jgi:hypothetical protein
MLQRHVTVDEVRRSCGEVGESTRLSGRSHGEETAPGLLREAT